MTCHVSLDRFEGKNKSLAVLLTDDGGAITLPKALLPRGARPGDVLSLTLERDDEATRRLAERTRAVQHELDRTDPGGDITL